MKYEKGRDYFNLRLNIDRNEFFCCCLRDSISKNF